MVSGLKDIFEDMKRHRADDVENQRHVVRAAQSEQPQLDSKLYFVNDQWKSLKVGNIVMIKSDEYFPADLILVKSSNPSGLCYVETKNLDGETNLKHKSAIKEVQHAITNPEQATNISGKVVCESPND